MKRETYKGRKLKAVKGRGGDWGYTRLTVNGVDLGKYLGDEDNALRSARGTIDHAEEVGVRSARYGSEWYAPGTFELCEWGHAKEIGGQCGHTTCVEKADAGRLTLEEAQAEAHTEWQMDQPAVVRIAYVDGTTEECRNIPSGEIAAGIFAEVCGNDRVAKAELVRGDGTVAAQWPLPDLPRATPRQGTCGRHGSRSVVLAQDLREHPACARGVGHPGLHRSVSYLPGRMAHLYWGDNECLPLDSGR